MPGRGNETCVQLRNVQKVGFVYENDLVYVKGTWFSLYFSVSISDGFAAWTLSASEEFVAERAKLWDVTGSEYVDMAHMLLSEQHSDSSYSLLCGTDDTVLLQVEPKQKIAGFSLELTLTKVPVPDVMLEMLEFVMGNYADLDKELARKMRSYDRMTAGLEKSVTQLQQEKLQVEAELFSLIKKSEEERKEIEGERAIEALEESLTGEKRKGDQNIEKGSRKSPRMGPAESSPLTLAAGRPPAHPREVSSEKPSKLRAAAERQEEMASAAVNIEGCLEETPIPHATANGRENADLTPNSKGRKKTILKFKGLQELEVLEGKGQASTTAAKKRSGKKQKKVAQKASAEKGEEAALDNIEEEVTRANKLSNPSTLVGSPNTEVGEERTQQMSLGKQNVRAASPQHSKESERGSAASMDKSDTNGAEVENSQHAMVALALIPTDCTADSPLSHDIRREMNVPSPDFYEFDGRRTENDLVVDQFWALYDDQDGMPRYYGRIASLSLSPFNVGVQWMEPIRPALRANCLVKSAGLSAACGEYKFAHISIQELNSFSHKVEIERGARGSIKYYPGKDQVWALYKDWEKPKPKMQDEEDDVKFDYELVEVLSGFSKENGLKVVPLIKVPGFKSLFKQGSGQLASWIPPKDVVPRLSHQIPTHRLLGSEKPGLPKGCWELDPASTPGEFLGVS